MWRYRQGGGRSLPLVCCGQIIMIIVSIIMIMMIIVIITVMIMIIIIIIIVVIITTRSVSEVRRQSIPRRSAAVRSDARADYDII